MRSLMQFLMAVVASFGVGVGAAVMDRAAPPPTQSPQAPLADDRPEAEACAESPSAPIADPPSTPPGTTCAEAPSVEPSAEAVQSTDPAPTTAPIVSADQPREPPPLALSIGLKSRW